MNRAVRAGGAVVLLISLTAPLQGQEGEVEEEEHLNTIELFLGGVTETEESATGLGAGLGYVRRLSPRWGIGAAGELSTTDVERAWLLNVPIYLFPVGGLVLKAGPVVEGSEEPPEEGEESEVKTQFGVRFGTAWEFEIGKRFVMAPEVNLDVVDGSATWVYGLSFGVGF